MPRNSSRSGDEEPRPSTLPFDPADLIAMRVLPSDFAKMVGVSKQAVSQWIKKGIVTLGPDGKLDPAVACKQVIERTDPGRLRARVFRQATATHDQLRRRVRELEAEAKGVEQATRYRCMDEHAKREGKFITLIQDRFESLVAAAGVGALDDSVGRLCWEANGYAPEEYPCDEDEGEDQDDDLGTPKARPSACPLAGSEPVVFRELASVDSRETSQCNQEGDLP